MRTTFGSLLASTFTIFAFAIACGDSTDDSTVNGKPNGGASGSGGSGASGGSGGNAGSGANGGNAGSSANGGTGGSIVNPAGGTSGSGGTGGVCASAAANAKLEPVFLAFAFDVSGSMGQGDYPWHDRTLKWEPVVAATKAFFEDPASAGISASLTFFPSAGDEATKCATATYQTPSVPMTALRSTAFASAIAAIEPQKPADWRGGTPTIHVMRGTIAYVKAQRQKVPGQYAIVLVTDGYPQSCGGQTPANTIANVATEAANVFKEGVATYVIGVNNPPLEGAPDTLDDLNAIAEKGGTEDALMINTGNPSATTTAFKAAVDAIRKRSVSCSVAIPPPPGTQTFNKEKVRVSYTSGAGSTDLVYDAACAKPNAWHYDSTSAPKEIVLCDPTCAAMRATSNPSLKVEFTCDRTIEIPD